MKFLLLASFIYSSWWATCFALGLSTQCDLHTIHKTLETCWSLDSAIQCRFCYSECSENLPCLNNEKCCVKECGTACSSANSTQKLTGGIKCSWPTRPAVRLGCPPIQVEEKCNECADRCKSDTDCTDRICCPTLCGKRCHEVIIF